jgi:4-amino-4-deoxy-L-arabinose transferase-like glycosyltransferase
VPLLLLLFLRLPSLFEPHWYTDEAGYATTAWLMTHGKVLYLTVWNNKPPLLFWIYDLALAWFGATELGLHLLSALAGLVALSGTWVLARTYLSPARTWAAMLLSAFLLGTPIFNGDLALPECFLIAFTVWAMVGLLAALRASGLRRALLCAGVAGLLLGLACLIQQTALADAFAGVLVVLLAGRRGRLLGLVATAVLVVVVGLVLMPFVAAAGAHNVFFFLVSSYAGYTSGTLHPALTSIGPRVLAGGLLLVGAWWARRWPPERLLPWVWLASLLLAYVIPNRPYVHFLLPAVPAAALILARINPVRLWRLPGRSVLDRAPLLGSTLVSAVLWMGLLGSQLGSGSLFAVKLTAEYYPAFLGRISGAISPVTFSTVYQRFPLAEQAALVWVRQHQLSGRTAVVWSADSWAYLLGGLDPVLPAPPIYMDQMWLGTKGLIARVEAERPVLIIVAGDSYPSSAPLKPFLRAAYTEVESADQGQLWVRAYVAVRLVAG